MNRLVDNSAASAPASHPPILDQLPSHVWVRLHDRDRVRRKLRISLTDHCNLSCFFCHNEGQGPIKRSGSASLSPPEIEKIISVARQEGVRKVKLTGGEPLLYRHGTDDIVSLVRRIAETRAESDDLDISATTNGTLLPRYAQNLAAVGLDRVTVSLTTMSEGTFTALIGPTGKLLSRTIVGLRAARAAGLRPLKINVVLYHSSRRRLSNLHELRDLLDIAVQSDVSELRVFTLLWHDSFPSFDEFYQYFSPVMKSELEALLKHCDVVAPRDTVELLAALGTTFAHHVYPKVEFGVDLGVMKLGFEAMKYGRLPSSAGLQEGPYAIRVGADGSLRPTLTGHPSRSLIHAVRRGSRDDELRRLFRHSIGGLP